jgi:hypothetical protein
VSENSVEHYDLGEAQAIDATGVDRIQAGQHSAERTDYTVRGGESVCARRS